MSNKIIRENEIKKIVSDTSISINQREEIFKKVFDTGFPSEIVRKKVIDCVDKICKIHGKNLIEHMKLEFRWKRKS